MLSRYKVNQTWFFMILLIYIYGRNTKIPTCVVDGVDTVQNLPSTENYSF